jgi:hypothetical protein
MASVVGRAAAGVTWRCMASAIGRAGHGRGGRAAGYSPADAAVDDERGVQPGGCAGRHPNRSDHLLGRARSSQSRSRRRPCKCRAPDRAARRSRLGRRWQCRRGLRRSAASPRRTRKRLRLGFRRLTRRRRWRLTVVAARSPQRPFRLGRAGVSRASPGVRAAGRRSGGRPDRHSVRRTGRADHHPALPRLRGDLEFCREIPGPEPSASSPARRLET